MQRCVLEEVEQAWRSSHFWAQGLRSSGLQGSHFLLPLSSVLAGPWAFLRTVKTVPSQFLLTLGTCLNVMGGAWPLRLVLDWG